MTRGRLGSIGFKMEGGERRCAAYPARVALQKFPHFWVVGVASLMQLEFTRIRGSRACQELAVELKF